MRILKNRSGLKNRKCLKSRRILRTKLVNSYVIDSPQPSNISYLWNFGSLLALCLIIQIITGVTLGMHYTPNVLEPFDSVEYIMRDVNNGWLIRYLHSNTASAFFFLVYLHIGRGSYYGSYKAPWTLTWTIGTVIFIFMMVTAFLGYVFPYGQMSLWGTTVITNLMSVIPWVGQDIVEFIWGGFSVNNATLNRFFTLHFVLPFVLAALSFFFSVYLHVRYKRILIYFLNVFISIDTLRMLWNTYLIWILVNSYLIYKIILFAIRLYIWANVIISLFTGTSISTLEGEILENLTGEETWQGFRVVMFFSDSIEPVPDLVDSETPPSNEHEQGEMNQEDPSSEDESTDSERDLLDRISDLGEKWDLLELPVREGESKLSDEEIHAQAVALLDEHKKLENELNSADPDNADIKEGKTVLDDMKKPIEDIINEYKEVPDSNLEDTEMDSDDTDANLADTERDSDDTDANLADTEMDYNPSDSNPEDTEMKSDDTDSDLE